MPNDLPEGFVLDSQPTVDSSSSASLPEGFELDPEKSYNGTSNTPFGTQDPNSTHAAINRWLMENVPSVIHGLANFAKGIPITGQMVDDNTIPGHEQYNKEHPIISGLEKATGAIASTAPLSAAAALPEAGLGANMLTQGGLFGGLGTADKVAQKANEGGLDEVTNTPASEYAATAGINAAAGALGPVLGKIISPNIIPRATVKDVPDAYDMSDELLKNLPEHAYDDLVENMTRRENMDGLYKEMGRVDKPAIPLQDTTNQAVIDALNKQNRGALIDKIGDALDSEAGTKITGALTGFVLGGGDFTSGILGEMLAPYLKGPVTAGAKKYLSNQAIGPDKQSILNSLLGESANTATNSQ